MRQTICAHVASWSPDGTSTVGSSSVDASSTVALKALSAAKPPLRQPGRQAAAAAAAHFAERGRHSRCRPRLSVPCPRRPTSFLQRLGLGCSAAGLAGHSVLRPRLGQFSSGRAGVVPVWAQGPMLQREHGLLVLAGGAGRRAGQPETAPVRGRAGGGGAAAAGAREHHPGLH